MYLRIKLFSLLYLVLVVVVRSEIHFFNVKPVGASGQIGLGTRWADAMGTALQPWSRGPLTKNQVYHSDRTGPVASSYREALFRSSTTCTPNSTTRCDVAINGFGTVGEVTYRFRHDADNLRGYSTQVQVACRCLSQDCAKALLMRPVNVLANGKQVGETCLYSRHTAIGKMSACHAELLRTVPRPVRQESPRYRNKFGFNFSVVSNMGEWVAVGERGWTNNIQQADLLRIPKLDVLNESILEDVAQLLHNSKTEYVQAIDPTDGAICAHTYAYGAAGAAWRGTQQDNHAVGKFADTYRTQKPVLITDTELALACSAAAIGAFTVWAMFWKRWSRESKSRKTLFFVVCAQLLLHILESLPLYVALVDEVGASSWKSEFAFVDGTLAVSTPPEGPQGTAKGSILILTAVVGRVGYKQTRVPLVAGLTVSFNVFSILGMLLTCAATRKYRMKQQNPPKEDGCATDDDDAHDFDEDDRKPNQLQKKKRSAIRALFD